MIHVADDEGAGRFGGRSFKKDEILKAMRLGSTTSNSNEKLFDLVTMRKIPQLQEWYDNLDGPGAATFADMRLKDFERWLDEQLTGKCAKGRKVKKHKHSSDSESGESSSTDEDSECRSHRKELKKGKKKAKRLSSEELD